MDLNRTDMFLGYDWLVKHNPEVNWKTGMIKFTRCPESCTMKHQDIRFWNQENSGNRNHDTEQQRNWEKTG